MAGAGGVRVSVAFNDETLEPSPTWTDLTELAPNLVAGYELQRGRQFELDYTDTGDYTVTINDQDGLLDPTNALGPYYGLIEPDLQLKVELYNPVADEWQSRFRGWIEDLDYDLDPSQRVQQLRIGGYDIFALMSLIEMQPGAFGDDPPGAPTARADTIYFDYGTFDDRINNALANAGILDDFAVVFSGNVLLLAGVYAPGDSIMNVIQEALDGEFPGVSNAYPDRFGRLAAHGRLAKFDPHGTWLGIAGDDAGRDARWEWRSWKLGDGAAVAASPSDTIQIRPPFSWNRGRSKIINSATAWPKGIAEADLAGQYVHDDVSIGLRGFQSWSKESLLTDRGIYTGLDANNETKTFANYYVVNYAEPRNRITALTVKAIDPRSSRAELVWDFLARADISHEVFVSAGFPGGGGFILEDFFVEGINETVSPATGDYAMVTMSLDVSPAAYFTPDDESGIITPS